MPLVSLAPSGTKIRENLHINENSSFCFSCAPSTVFCIVRTDLSTSTETSTTLSVNCSLITLHGFFWTDWTFGICLCYITGTSITLQCGASGSGFLRCTHHRDDLVFLHLHGVCNLHGHLIDFLWMDSLHVDLVDLGCFTLAVWTTCLVVCLIFHSGGRLLPLHRLLEDFGVKHS